MIIGQTIRRRLICSLLEKKNWHEVGNVKILKILLKPAGSLSHTEWDKTVQNHLKALPSIPAETLWPRDTLFK